MKTSYMTKLKYEEKFRVPAEILLRRESTQAH